MADLPVPLLREALVDPQTGLVTRAWIPWFESWYATLVAESPGGEFGIGPSATLQTPQLGALEREMRGLLDAVSVPIPSDRTIPDIAHMALMPGQTPTEAHTLAQRSGDYYQRHGLAY